MIDTAVIGGDVSSVKEQPFLDFNRIRAISQPKQSSSDTHVS